MYPAPFLPISCVLANSIRDMRFSLFSISLTMLAVVTSTLAGLLNHAIDNPGVPFNWKRSRDIDLPNLRSRMDSLENSQQEYRSSKLGPADKATMLEELRTQSLEAIALLEKCIQLYDIEWSWSAHNVWLQEMATNVFDDYHSAIERIAPNNPRRPANLYIPKNRPDPSFNHLVFWEIVGKMDVVTSAPLEHRKLIGLIQERAYSRFRRWFVEQEIYGLVDYRDSQMFWSFIPHFYNDSFRRALNLPESFDWDFPADTLIRDNRDLTSALRVIEMGVDKVSHMYGGVYPFTVRFNAWDAMVKCDSLIYAHIDKKPSEYWRDAIAAGKNAYIQLMKLGIGAEPSSVDVKSESMEQWTQDIPAQLSTHLLSFELYRLMYWNAAINAGAISKSDYQRSKDLQKLLATVSGSRSIKNLLSKWKNVESSPYVKIKLGFDMLGHHINTLEL